MGDPKIGDFGVKTGSSGIQRERGWVGVTHPRAERGGPCLASKGLQGGNREKNPKMNPKNTNGEMWGAVEGGGGGKN